LDEVADPEVEVEVDGMGSPFFGAFSFLAFFASLTLFLRASIFALTDSISSSSTGFKRMTSAMSNGF
jgi:hypothetical protein